MPNTNHEPEYYTEGINNYNPCFNPRNDNEFIYIRKDFDKGTSEIIKHSLLTNTSNILLKNVSSSCHLTWGENGWIIYTNDNIYKLKDNGDSFTIISTPYNYSKTDVCYTKENNFLFTLLGSPNSGNKIINNNGLLVDSLEGLGSQQFLLLNEVSSENILAGKIENDKLFKIKVCDLNTKVYQDIKVLTTDYPNNQIKGLTWHPNNQDIIYSILSHGIFIINKNTGNEIKIIDGDGLYGFVSISPNGKNIIFERIDFKKMSNQIDFLMEHNIFIIDINGNNLKKLEFL
ncbi:MAG: hypothetical protein PSX81_07365 [bacterium]|nr:hypothetical protein [bacterium]